MGKNGNTSIRQVKKEMQEEGSLYTKEMHQLAVCYSNVWKEGTNNQCIASQLPLKKSGDNYANLQLKHVAKGKVEFEITLPTEGYENIKVVDKKFAPNGVTWVKPKGKVVKFVVNDKLKKLEYDGNQEDFKSALDYLKHLDAYYKDTAKTIEQNPTSYRNVFEKW